MLTNLGYTVILPPLGTPHGVWWQQRPLSVPEASLRSSGGGAAEPACHPHAGGRMTADES